MSNTSSALTVIPAELKNQLPIFQVLGDRLPAPLKTPEGKKTISSIFYWALILGGAYWFFTNLDTLLEYATKSILFIIFGIIFIVLLMLAPQIIKRSVDAYAHALSRSTSTGDMDDMLVCGRCRKRFDIPNFQSVVFI